MGMRMPTSSTSMVSNMENGLELWSMIGDGLCSAHSLLHQLPVNLTKIFFGKTKINF